MANAISIWIVILNGDKMEKTTKAPIHAWNPIKNNKKADNKININFRVNNEVIKSAKQNNPPIAPNNLLIYSAHVLKTLKFNLSYPLSE